MGGEKRKELKAKSNKALVRMGVAAILFCLFEFFGLFFSILTPIGFIFFFAALAFFVQWVCIAGKSFQIDPLDD